MPYKKGENPDGNHAGGAPSYYEDKYCDDVDEYLESCDDLDGSFITFEGDKGTGYQRKVDVDLPSQEGFAEFLRNKYEKSRKYNVGTFWNWEEKYPEFLQATTRIRTVQAIKLMNGTLSGKYEKGMAMMILKSQSRHYQPTDKAEISGPGGGAIKTESSMSDDQINKILDVLNESKE